MTTDLVVDWQALEQRYRHKNDFVHRLATIFMEVHGGDSARLRQLADQADYNEIEQITHTLKGALGNLQAPKSLALATGLLNLARQQSPASLAQARLLADALEQLIETLSELPEVQTEQA